MLNEETLAITNTALSDSIRLSDLYSSRGETYLMLNRDGEAQDDFLMAQEYASICNQVEQPLLIFRSTFGLFLTKIRMEQLEDAKLLAVVLQNMMNDFFCYECQKKIHEKTVFLQSNAQTA